MGDPLRKCVKCKKVKPISEFYYYHRRGLYHYECKVCTNGLRTGLIKYESKARKNKARKKRESETCRILKDHHNILKNDPEHLTTKFIIKIAKIKTKE
jgi:hypothetical protein